MTGGLYEVDSKQFEMYKKDESFMDEWAKCLIETVWDDERDSPILPIIKELLKLADKELYLQARDKRITIRQFKTRCMERLNGNQFPFIDYDDIVHMIIPECQNLDLRKINKWSMAAYGKPMDQLPLKGPDSFINHLEDWQITPHCLRSIANFYMTERKLESVYYGTGPKPKYGSVPPYREWDF